MSCIDSIFKYSVKTSGQILDFILPAQKTCWFFIHISVDITELLKKQIWENESKKKIVSLCFDVVV